MSDSHEFTHDAVLLDEAIAGLAIQANGFYFDGTFGRGGHSRAILSQLSAEGGLMATDKDPEAERLARQLMQEDSRFCFFRGSFAGLKTFFAEVDREQLNGVLFDLGVSSPQLDDAARGFSFTKDGPLDMRMNNEVGQSAASWLASAEEKAIANVLWEFGEERYSRRIAKAIAAARVARPIERTLQLAEIIAKAHPRWEKGKHPATRSFQAIRIFVNGELNDLTTGLEAGFELLGVGGRLVAISFHSLEDRLVKRFMQEKVSGPQVPKWVPLQEDAPRAKILAKKVRAGKAEVERNVRSRSAVLRVLEKLR